MNHLGDTNKMVSDTPRTDEAYFKNSATMYDLAGEMKQIERELNVANEKIEVLLIADCERLRIGEELNAANQRIKRLEEALDLVIPNCSWVHHSKKHQHKCGEPCPVVALIEKSKEDKL